MKKLAFTLALILGLNLGPTSAQAQDCQYGSALDINVMTHIQTITCNPAPTQADLERQTQDHTFQEQIKTLQKTAEAESRAYSEANPGQQKCVTYTLTHPNGVSEASGGVCVNAVEPISQTTTSTPIVEIPAITQVSRVKAIAKPKAKAKPKPKAKVKAKKKLKK
jgi:hypothetical protein